MITNQEAFDTVARHLLTQKKKSIRTGCLYRGPGGTKCAIGCLFPDDVYSPSMENKSVSSLMRAYPIVTGYLPELGFARELQNVHDGAETDKWIEQLTCLASRRNLSIGVMNDFSRERGEGSTGIVTVAENA